MINEETQNDLGLNSEIESEKTDNVVITNNDILSEEINISDTDEAISIEEIKESSIEEETAIGSTQENEIKSVFRFVDDAPASDAKEIPVENQEIETNQIEQEISLEKESIVQTEETIPAVPEQEQVVVKIQENPSDVIVTPVEATSDTSVLTAEETERKELIKSARQKFYDQIYDELKEKKNKRETIEVEVKARIRGGLRVHYKDLPLFLPTSHYTLKRNPTEDELQKSVGEKFPVFVHEIQEFDEGKKAAIVSRKKLLVKEMWDQIKVGDIIEGRISSVPTFGVFVDFLGLEGLIHVSQLSKAHVDVPSKYYKKGQEIKARIIEIVKEKKKIGLSSKEFEGSLWKGVEEQFKPGMQVDGKVKRITDFGAYIEIKPGVDGLLRNSELSWTKRYKNAAEILQIGDNIKIEILTISEEKESATFSLRKTTPNPWPQLSEKLKVNTEVEGIVLQVIPQGAVINVLNEIDGFMPRSKMRNVMKGKNKIPYKTGDKVFAIVADVNPEEYSLILAPKEIKDDFVPRPSQERRHFDKPKQTTNESGFSLGDMLSDTEKAKLSGFSS